MPRFVVGAAVSRSQRRYPLFPPSPRAPPLVLFFISRARGGLLTIEIERSTQCHYLAAIYAAPLAAVSPCPASPPDNDIISRGGSRGRPERASQFRSSTDPADPSSIWKEREARKFPCARQSFNQKRRKGESAPRKIHPFLLFPLAFSFSSRIGATELVSLNDGEL